MSDQFIFETHTKVRLRWILNITYFCPAQSRGKVRKIASNFRQHSGGWKRFCVSCSLCWRMVTVKSRIVTGSRSDTEMETPTWPEPTSSPFNPSHLIPSVDVGTCPDWDDFFCKGRCPSLHLNWMWLIREFRKKLTQKLQIAIRWIHGTSYVCINGLMYACVVVLFLNANCVTFPEILLILTAFCSTLLGAREFARKRPSTGASFKEMWWFSGDLWTWLDLITDYNPLFKRILSWRWMPHRPNLWIFMMSFVEVSHLLTWSAQAQTFTFYQQDKLSSRTCQ